MLNHSASLAMSTSVLKALSGKLDIKIHSPSILYFQFVLIYGAKQTMNIERNAALDRSFVKL